MKENTLLLITNFSIDCEQQAFSQLESTETAILHVPALLSHRFPTSGHGSVPPKEYTNKSMIMAWHQRMRNMTHLIEILFLTMLLIQPITVFSQLSQDKDPFSVNIIPPSPEAAALAKYADIPVSLYSGTPQISIPLYELQERELSLPISVNYHASGNKVGTIATRTGLGWTLEASGVITRTVMGWPDEYGPRGFLHQAQQHEISDFALGNLPAAQQFPWYDAMAEGCMDIEPDLFYFNFAGYTGKFMFNWDGSIDIASGSNLKITPIGMNPGTVDFIDGWQVVVEDGTTFIFSIIEISRAISSPSLSCRLGLNDADMPQSWYLSEIRSANQQSWIRFEYEDYDQTTESWSMETMIHNESLAPTQIDREKLITKISGKHLKRITTSSGQTAIYFWKGAQRTDVTGNSYTLGTVTVHNIHNRTIKDWKFEYDYSTRRLTLKKITEWAGTLSKPPYSFVYQGSLSDPLSFAQDHWGFHNSNSAQTLIPATTVYRLGDPNPVELSGANREPSDAKVLSGLLKEIQYPTGGIDVLQFEPHDYSFEQREELIKEVVIPRKYSESVPDFLAPVNAVDTDEIEFTLPSETEIKLTAEFTYRTVFGGSAYPISVTIKNKKTNEQVVSLSPGGVAQRDQDGNIIPDVKRLTASYQLKAGVYSLILSAKISPSSLGGQNSVWVSINYEEGTGKFFTEIKRGGGVRIAKLTRVFGNGNPNKVTRYAYRITEHGEEKSSGSLLESGYKYADWMQYAELLSGKNAGDYTTKTVNKFLRFSQNRSALGTTQGSHVGYSAVTVWQGEQGENGKTIYTYNSPRQIRDYAHFEVPYPPAESFDYQRGLLLEQTDFDKFGILLKKVQNEYTFHQKKVPALKVGWAVPGAGITGPEYLDRYALGFYSNILGYSRLKSTRETLYFPGNSEPVSFETVQLYEYNEHTHKQLVKIVTTDSERDSVCTQMTYPQDYPSGTSPVLDSMRNRHIVNHVIEKLVWKKNANAQISLLSAMKTNYKLQDTYVLPSSVNSARISEPIVTAHPLNTAQSLYEERLVYHSYDQYGNLIEHAMKDGVRTAYVWAENGTVLIAKADHAKSHQIFHTSFEDVMQAASFHQKTGRKSLGVTNGMYTIPAEHRPVVGGNYMFTYWMKEGSSEWVYKEKIIQNYQPGNAITTDAFNGYIDEVRLYPEGAKMTTFTYEPLVGIASVTDANNVTVYYEYDAFNRLKCKRDQDQNILECYDYAYQEEVPYAFQN